ncbi:MAG: FtsW/RodA/SpoVE family cell cycle protein, partial [Clostridia bacterium]|nr:FtsW/RodA/SpoVE family cell cycle protein [Clostridia bacterium]
MLKKIAYSVTSYLKKTDLMLLFTAVAASTFGLILIYSATLSYGTKRYLVIQGLALIFGIVGFIIASLSDLRRFPRLWVWLFIFNVLFQLSLFFLGTAGDTGNKSWINYSWMPMAIQPGEIGKIIFIYTFASHVNLLKGKLNRPRSVAVLLAHFIVTVFAVFVISRDLGVSVIYVFIFLAMLYASGIKLGWFFGVLGVCVGSAPLLWKFMDEYQQLRIKVVLDPEISPKYA